MPLSEWLVRSLVFAALLGFGASLLEQVVVRRRRFVWLAALLASLVVPLLALNGELWPTFLRRAAPEASPVLSELRGESVEAGTSADMTVLVTDGLETSQSSQASLTVRDVVPLVWLVLSVIVALRWLHGWRVLRAARLRCREQLLAGENVLISDGLGPAVVGLRRPRIIVPQWLLAAPAERQHIIVRHEAEHIRARDHWLLGLAPLFAALLPWNAAVWWQVRRLRVAIELDCDSRVLHSGVSSFAYGSLLLDVAAGTRSVHPSLLSLSEPHTSLERRIRAMTPVRTDHTTTRAASFVALSALLAGVGVFAIAPAATPVAAQEPPPPVVREVKPPKVELKSTSLPKVDVQVKVPPKVDLQAKVPPKVDVKAKTPPKVDVKTKTPPRVELKTVPLPTVQLQRQEGTPLFVVDGTPRPATAKLDFADLDVRSIEILKPAEAEKRFGTAARFGAVLVTTDPSVTRPDTVRTPKPIIVVDGVIIDESFNSNTSKADIPTFERIGSDARVFVNGKELTIDRIEVIKGPAAAAIYGERAVNGVIVITTKK